MLTTTQDVARRIRAGEKLLLAAQEQVLLSLPAGNWIGGTIPYFMSDKGGVTSREAVFVSPVPPEVVSIRIETYDAARLPSICVDAPDNGVSFLILPATSAVHLEFAQKAPSYEQMYMKPLVGWISGVHLDDLGKVPPKVVDGRTVTAYADRAVVLHGTLAAKKVAQIGIVNLFKQGGGDTLVFPKDGFQADAVEVNGTVRNLAEYLTEKKIDTRLPLVADYSGAMINVSFQGVDAVARKVSFYAPVFAGVRYQVAAPVADYVSSFGTALPKGLRQAFSCNCILNYLYCGLEGKQTGGMTGPITFGEIAFQLLNQTLVYLTIENA